MHRELWECKLKAVTRTPYLEIPVVKLLSTGLAAEVPAHSIDLLGSQTACATELLEGFAGVHLGYYGASFHIRYVSVNGKVHVSQKKIQNIMHLKKNMLWKEIEIHQETYFLHMVQFFLGAGLWEKADRQVVEQNRWAEPLRWYAVWPFFKGFLQLAHVTFMVRCGCWVPEDWQEGLDNGAVDDAESTPVCFWFRGKEAD
ncbi:hypothetical protein DNTS_000009 [Danionella cerebrum]|uniref:Uncharacterized protein n=1 Tax=Danionella cerebrum TaxID=2873325 RepID=A0A553QIK3_9TELE|nr:hypothetical protein DNTS_000009 [Danionella translucida]